MSTTRTPPTLQPAQSWTTCIRSDSLRHFEPVLELINNLLGEQPAFRKIVRCELVVDAQAVQRELRWRLRNRLQPQARSSLHEAVDAGVVRLLAPRWLDQEIANHAAEIATYASVTIESVMREWQDVRRLITLCPPRPPPDVPGRDPKDAAYVDIYLYLGADGVLTQDGHFPQAGVKVISVDDIVQIRTYARCASMRINLNLIEGGLAAISYRLLQALARAFAKLPPSLRLVLGGVVVWALTSPSVRAAIRAPTRPVVGFLAEVISVAEAASHGELAALDQFRAAPPQTGRRTAIQYARHACVAAGKPITLEGLLGEMCRLGYRPRTESKSTAYLRRLLRESGEFGQASTGRWSLRSGAAA